MCAHNGSCWLFPPRLSPLSSNLGPITPEAGLVSTDLFSTDLQRRHDQEEGHAVKRCVCPAGWWGKRCHRLDLCVMASRTTRYAGPRCLNHGNCTRTFQRGAHGGTPDYSCTCPRKFTKNSRWLAIPRFLTDPL